MRIWFLGAAQEVTGSMYLLELAQGTLLIDCGFFQGRREDSRKRNSHLPSNIMSADAVILTHAHIDHSGSIPTLVKAGYTGPITQHQRREISARTCCVMRRGFRKVTQTI